MKNLLILTFLIGLFAFSCRPSPGKVTSANAQTQFAQVADLQAQVLDCSFLFKKSITQFAQVADLQAQVPVINAADQTTLPTTDTPAPIKWVDENLWSTLSGVLLLIYEFLALKMPTSKSISILGNLYKLLTWFVPDKSNKGGQFSIRDKL